MSVKENQKYLVSSILAYFKDCLNNETLPNEGENGTENLKVAIQCISNAFGLDLVSDVEQRYSVGPTKLEDIFGVFLDKKRDALKQAESERKEKAESFKNQGNNQLALGNSEEAVRLYTEAINLDSGNAIYYSNRAAAYSQHNKHENAVEDAQKAIKLDPSYSKAYGRLGLAQLSLKNYEKAVESYEKAVSLDPTNANFQTGLKNAKSKVEGGSSRRESNAPPNTSTGGGAGGMPDLSALLGGAGGGAGGGMPDLSSLLGGAGGGAGGAGGGLASLLNNPQISAMMNNPELMSNLMSNPALMNMAQSFLGGAGGGAAGAPPAARRNPNNNNGSGNNSN